MKKRAYIKIACTAAALLCAMAMIVMSSYAWLTASTSPVAEGIQVAVGGGSTILLAPDVVNNEGVHYPGAFGATLRLDNLLDADAHSGLTPVSTADGLNWYLPVYYTEDDLEVRAETAKAGDLKPYDQFLCDETLTYANLAAGDEKAAEGSYLYVDFWVVSPGSRYELRVSTSNDASGAGSYVVDMPQVVETEVGFAMQTPEYPASENLRVGFLVNQNAAAESADAYAANRGDQRYTTLRGDYQKAEEQVQPAFSYNTFHIYEPNGSSHSALGETGYIATYPLGRNDTSVTGIPVGGRLSVQMASQWEKNKVNDLFTVSVQQAGDTATAADVQARLYKNLAGRSDYVNKGQFIQNTNQLYTSMGEDHTVLRTTLEKMDKAGANESNSIVTLERNVPQRIRMFIWLEGQDADCVSGASVSGFAMRIELAGSTVK